MLARFHTLLAPCRIEGCPNERPGLAKRLGSLACCFEGLGIGDHAAVDIARDTHVNLPRFFGVLNVEESEVQAPSAAFPSGFVERIVIDDACNR